MMNEESGASSDDDSSADTTKVKKKKKEARLKEADSITFSPLPPPQKFRSWKLAFKEHITSASGDPGLALRWMGDVNRATSWQELKQVKRSISLESKIASDLNKIIHGELGRKIGLLKERLATTEKLSLGRQIVWLVYKQYKPVKPKGRSPTSQISWP